VSETNKIIIIIIIIITGSVRPKRNIQWQRGEIILIKNKR